MSTDHAVTNNSLSLVKIGCAAAILNIALLLVSCTEWFGGTGSVPGLADSIWGQMRFGGFRADFIWIVISSAAFFFVGLGSLTRVRTSRGARALAVCSFCEVATFLFYAFHVMRSGVLDFG